MSRLLSSRQTIINNAQVRPRPSDLNQLASAKPGALQAANHKSDYLYEVQDVQDRSQDLTVRAQTQFDLSIAYALNKQMQVVFEGINLNDSKYYVYQGQASRNAQYESYGPSYRLGLRVNLD